MAFSLFEVMIAVGIFFMAVFTILALVANTLRNARALQKTTVNPGMVAAYFSSVTNRLEEGMQSGTFDDLGDFGGLYRDYDWTSDTYEVGSNGLVQVDYIIQRRSGGQVEAKMSILVFDPNFKSSFGGGLAR